MLNTQGRRCLIIVNYVECPMTQRLSKIISPLVIIEFYIVYYEQNINYVEVYLAKTIL